MNQQQFVSITENLIFYISLGNLPKALLGTEIRQLNEYLIVKNIDIDSFQSPLLFNALDILNDTWDEKLALLIKDSTTKELNLNYKNLNNVNILHQAIFSNKIKSTQELFKKIQLCPDLIQKAYPAEYSFLQCALMSKNINMFHYVLTQDSDVKYQNKNGDDCLKIAIKGYPTMLKFMQPYYSSQELECAQNELENFLMMRASDVINSRHNILSRMIEFKRIEEEKKQLESLSIQADSFKKNQLKI